MQKINFRNAKNDDTEKILNLFFKVFGRKISKKFWNWRFKTGIFGKPLIRIAIDQSKIISNHISYPIQLCYKIEKIKALISMTHITLESHSGIGIMTNLCNQTYEIGKKKNFLLNFAFLNKNSRHMFTKKNRIF